MAREQIPDFPPEPLQEQLAPLVRATCRAKRAAARMYRAWHTKAPDRTARRALARMGDEEAAHGRALDRVLGLLTVGPPFPPAERVGREEGQTPDESWASATMAAFSLDQAATACLIALTGVDNSSLSQVAHSIVKDEEDHQRFVIGGFRKLVDAQPTLGPRLAAEMIVARDWVRDVYPRRAALAALADAGLVPREAPRAHDSFLAGLGDRIQDALGVLGM
ncbi:MAG TPA: ferritin-like domain-containing protein [Chloroflexota bacterium]|nr:ferritin-like domain-containing protein [Chloroflexota bacterium]